MTTNTKIDNAATALADISAAGSEEISRAGVITTATLALGLGLGLLSVVGYAQASHDVAHDARHAFSFPCH